MEDPLLHVQGGAPPCRNTVRAAQSLRSRRTGRGRVTGRAYTAAVPRDHHRPVHFTDAEFAAIQGGEDPALVNRVAHETAN
ncbi:hypothetical protein, partial [Bacillus altitudinis]|uniref:hypothetical protein n=1 Tax=Bacillus altitudinis TaxID=293387 RepID=UPI001F2E7F3F